MDQDIVDEGLPSSQTRRLSRSVVDPSLAPDQFDPMELAPPGYERAYLSALKFAPSGYEPVTHSESAKSEALEEAPPGYEKIYSQVYPSKE